MTSGRPNTFTTEAVVLRHSDLGEADRLLWLLTPERGVIRATARGARKPGSKLGGHIDLLFHVKLSIREGRELHGVSQADTIDAFRAMRTDIGRLSRALYIGELSLRVSVEDAPSHAVFRLLINSLGWLATTENEDTLVRWFTLRLLTITGFKPEFGACVECGDELEPADHVFSAERGGLLCPRCRSQGSDVLLPAGLGSIKVLRHLTRSDYPAIESLIIGAEERRQIERILRSHTNSVIDRDVRSSAFLDEVRDWPDAGPVPGGLRAE
ncbi:MAG TPA: DNA repair protein RecO [Dehalococcoidia bacterium]|jgi:DNA repair protein RecO (recombination protein O)|nr:DNA repair protein RecO [Chloroflexota bacterium]MDP5878026.1 DNA repair protein RecO [Dehalococcoidia bacterium]MDP6273786.1 DNA repair protein RecO [Dehalococcoidia bacterium]MDP7161290.1 DNA repair protein RecO [Dehalococcoidia bacterium]MDP7214221.1 DNA repair protein RecO [Dehalococcoidia bacterium]|tara:strand:+ start:838 stop:1644 length:807 start_codon:yes stop_codon:yes gene_type:complete